MPTIRDLSDTQRSVGRGYINRIALFESLLPPSMAPALLPEPSSIPFSLPRRLANFITKHAHTAILFTWSDFKTIFFPIVMSHLSFEYCDDDIHILS